jgi:hypothetical protein
MKQELINQIRDIVDTRPKVTSILFKTLKTPIYLSVRINY